MKKLVVLGTLATAYLIGELVAGIEVGLAVSSIAREKEYTDEEKRKTYNELVKNLHYPCMIKEAKALIKDRH